MPWHELPTKSRWLHLLATAKVLWKIAVDIKHLYRFVVLKVACWKWSTFAPIAGMQRQHSFQCFWYLHFECVKKDHLQMKNYSNGSVNANVQHAWYPQETHIHRKSRKWARAHLRERGCFQCFSLFIYFNRMKCMHRIWISFSP